MDGDGRSKKVGMFDFVVVAGQSRVQRVTGSVR